ncbi:hypothetical protein [Aliivibrio fischeri]|uniref:hypothetical protein n=1 Tax=Aliivibrio fischeri TaxID=668 RepID=UPI00080DDE7D|nr:hypothetical protein [Aliivibrio fischeri]OCH34620.1 hypothetical protein A6E02_19135 [Aliivibrio fischeri]
MNPSDLQSTLQTKKEYDADYRAKRKARKQELIALHHSVVDAENDKKPKTPFKFDFRSRRLLRSGKWETLPPEYARILKSCEEFIDNPNRFPALNAWGGEGVNNIQCRRLVANVLACIIVNTDLIGGRIGLPTEAGLKTISYDHLQEDYALRFGRFISPKSFAKAISYLKRAGYLHSERVNVCVDMEEGTIRSAPAYKQFTERFFSDLKVVRYSNICALIIASRKRQEQKGLRFSWMTFREIASGVQEVFNAEKLNGFAHSVKAVFEAYQPQLSPH